MTHNKNKTVLFANGDLPLPKHLRAQLNNNDFFIAVDGGLSYITAMKLKPNLIIGDLDSADPELVDRFKAQGVEVRKYPPEKNETDLELALDAALEMKPDIIWIAGALGNRLDQTLGNVFLLIHRTNSQMWMSASWMAPARSSSSVNQPSFMEALGSAYLSFP